MTTGLTARPEPNVRVEMKEHRERLKRATHPGRTQREAAFTPSQSRWLTIGVCEDLACDVERGERIANRLLAVLVVTLLLALGYGAVQGRWAEPPSVQTVEAGR